MTNHTKLSIDEIILDAYKKGDNETIRRLEYSEPKNILTTYVFESGIEEVLDE